MLNIEIDGQKLQAEPGKMIIQAADDAGIYIPRFCYHKKLTIAANCRMCLVQVGESKKPAPACATPISEGMKVYTKSEVALNAQKAVMEFLLINHPLDCPICDQGGQCELQDLSMGFGRDVSRFTERKRVVKDKDIGPLVETDMTRCIHCTRCVRFGREIAGFPELGLTGRGEHTEIGTYIAHAMESELSGNVIEVCPVGALTAKPSRYKFRAWEVQQRDTIAPHDCIGSALHAHVRRDEVMRVVPKENEALNEVWISDRDRFSYEGLNSDERVSRPMIKRDGEWCTVDWMEALQFATDKLQRVIHDKSADQVAGFISPSSTLEEQFLFQKYLRALGVKSIDYRLQETDFRDQGAWQPALNMEVAEVENLKTILLVGANVAGDQPILGIRLRKAIKKGAAVIAVQHAICYPGLSTHNLLTHDLVQRLANIAKAAGCDTPILKDCQPTEEDKLAAEKLLQQPAAILLGIDALRDANAAILRYLARLLAQKTGATLGFLPMGSNSVGANSVGCLPDAQYDWCNAVNKKLAAYVLFGVEPEDCVQPLKMFEALQQAECVIAMTAFTSSAMLDYANVILPIAPFTETSGTYINIQQDWQRFTAVVNPLNEARPGWKVLRVLGNFSKLNNFEYASVDEVSREIKMILENTKPIAVSWQPESLSEVNGLQFKVPALSYRADALVRRSAPLQATPHNNSVLLINAKTAAQLNLQTQALIKQDVGAMILPVNITDHVADGVVVIACGTMHYFEETRQFEVQPC